MKIIKIPQLRQTFDYDCGAKALQSVLVYYGIDIRQDTIMKYAKTTEEGTPVKGIVKVARKYKLKTESKSMTISELKKYLDKKIPVILLLQAWTKQKDVDWENNWIDGHYAVVVGYTKNKIIFEDPYSFHLTYLKYDELKERWHDISKGKKYFNHGIAIFGKKPAFRLGQITHMD